MPLAMKTPALPGTRGASNASDAITPFAESAAKTHHDFQIFSELSCLAPELPARTRRVQREVTLWMSGKEWGDGST
jgi:hypothetical protein